MSAAGQLAHLLVVSVGSLVPWRSARARDPPTRVAVLGGGFAGYSHLPAELFANALLVALAARGWRRWHSFYEKSRDADAAAARTSVATLTSTLASVRTSVAAFTSTLTSAGGGAP